jgi:hypothetical protein
MVDAVTKLLIEKSVISESEFKEQSEPGIRRSCTNAKPH